MSNLAGYFYVSSNTADTFSTSVYNDTLIFTDSNTQRIMIGNNKAGGVPALTFTSNVTFFGNNNVGIGTSNPTYSLDVNGSLRVTGNSSTISVGTWIAPTFTNGWSGYTACNANAYEPAGYLKDALGRVWLRGFINANNVNNATAPVFTLPTAYCPPYTAYLNPYTFGATANVYITSNGNVVSGMTGTLCQISLSGISFPTT